ncbi:MAG: hypothetical protein ACYC40_03270 [Patescibacteria group bacterium]
METPITVDALTTKANELVVNKKRRRIIHVLMILSIPLGIVLIFFLGKGFKAMGLSENDTNSFLMFSVIAYAMMASALNFLKPHVKVSQKEINEALKLVLAETEASLSKELNENKEFMLAIRDDMAETRVIMREEAKSFKKLQKIKKELAFS